jgi:hypothetical protein
MFDLPETLRELTDQCIRPRPIAVREFKNVFCTNGLSAEPLVFTELIRKALGPS